jgi:hypothetical protein
MPESGQSGTRIKKMPMPKPVQYRKETLTGIGLLGYRNEMTDAGSISLDADAQRLMTRNSTRDST